MGLTLPEDGKVVALDVSEEFTAVGNKVWAEAGISHKIDLRIAPAVESLQRLVDEEQSGTFDFAYIDADKSNYDSYYELCLQLVRVGGIVAVDNVLWHGRLLQLKVALSLPLSLLLSSLAPPFSTCMLLTLPCRFSHAPFFSLLL